MKKRANILKKSAALFAVMAGGVVFCCSKKNTGIADNPVQITDLPLEMQRFEDDETTQDTVNARQEEIWVYVCGMVRHPGVYSFDAGARVYEAIERAGGFSEQAQEEAVNLARSMTDGERIYVPDRSGADLSGLAGSEQDGDLPSGRKVNINQADEDELMTLPGIGKAKAELIIAYRQQHPFRNIEEIMNVSGIKDNSFQKIRDLITT